MGGRDSKFRRKIMWPNAREKRDYTPPIYLQKNLMIPGLQNELCGSETSIFCQCAVQFSSCAAYSRYRIFGTSGINFREGREEVSDTTQLQTEMQNNINENYSSKCDTGSV